MQATDLFALPHRRYAPPSEPTYTVKPPTGRSDADRLGFNFPEAPLPPPPRRPFDWAKDRWEW